MKCHSKTSSGRVLALSLGLCGFLPSPSSATPSTTFYFTDSISLLTGPVFYLDKALQPGGRGLLWTAQIDVDIPVERK